MNITEYTERIFGGLNVSKQGIGRSIESIYLSFIDTEVPKDSLVVLGGRPRTGMTSLILDFIAKNSLKKESDDEQSSPKKGLVYFINHRETFVLQRWVSIVTQSLFEDGESKEFLDYLLTNYSKAIDGSIIDMNFISTSEKLSPAIEKQIKSTDPDYIIIDGLNFSTRNLSNTAVHTEIIDNLIRIRKETKKMVLLSTSLGHEARERGGCNRHYLEDLNAPQIEAEADVVLLFHRPELHGIEIDEEGYSMKGVVEIDTAINRYGNEGVTISWHGLHALPKMGKLMAFPSE